MYRGSDATNLSQIAAIDRTVNTSYSFLDTSVVHGTRYYYAVTAVNGVGEGAQISSAITADLSLPPPPPVITSPASGSLQRAFIKVQGTATQGAKIELFVNGMSLAMASADAAGIWQAYLHRPDLDGNIITIHAVARSTTNGAPSGESNRVTVDIDATSPTGDIDNTDQAQDPASQASQGKISGVASDNRRVASVVVRYYNYSSGVLLGESVAECLCDGKFATWTDEPELPSGVYQVSIRVTDLAGNLNNNADYHRDLLLWEPTTSTAVTCSQSYVKPLHIGPGTDVHCTGSKFENVANERLSPLGIDPGSGQGVIGPTAPTGISEGDVYEIDTVAGQSVSVSVSYITTAPEQDIDLFVFKGSGPAFHADVAKSTNPSGVTDSVTFIAQGGTYSIVALGWLIAADQPYRMTTSASENFIGDNYYLSTYGTTIL